MKELFEAIRAGDSSRVAELVAADPSLEIFAAAIQGDTARIEVLLAGNRSLVSALSSDGWTPLHLAAFFGKLDAARLLLNKGAEVNARSTNAMENMPLHAAAAGRHADVVKLLVEKIRKIADLVGSEAGAGFSTLHGMAFREERADGVAISIVQHGEAANQVGTFLCFGHTVHGSARSGAMTGEAFRNVDFLAAIRGHRIGDLAVSRTRAGIARGTTSAAAPAACSRPGS